MASVFAPVSQTGSAEAPRSILRQPLELIPRFPDQGNRPEGEFVAAHEAYGRNRPEPDRR